MATGHLSGRLTRWTASHSNTHESAKAGSQDCAGRTGGHVWSSPQEKWEDDGPAKLRFFFYVRERHTLTTPHIFCTSHYIGRLRNTSEESPMRERPAQGKHDKVLWTALTEGRNAVGTPEQGKGRCRRRTTRASAEEPRNKDCAWRKSKKRLSQRDKASTNLPNKRDMGADQASRVERGA